MDKSLHNQRERSDASRWRRQPLYAATRLRCAIAMMILAVAVVLSALPSLATSSDCDTTALHTEAPQTLWAPNRCERLARRD